MRNSVLKLEPKDNALIALRDLRQGDQISYSNHAYTLVSDVPAKHKFAAEDLHPGSDVFMYGVLVGKATQAIHRGEILTTRNTRHAACPFQDKVNEYHWTPPDVSAWRPRTFL